MAPPLNAVKSVEDQFAEVLAAFQRRIGGPNMDWVGGDAILMYHAVGQPGRPSNVPTEQFRQDVEAFDQSYELVTVRELVSTDSEQLRMALTFDDGLASFRSTAWPILSELGIPATVFVIADTVIDGINHVEAGSLPIPPSDTMTESEVADLASNPRIEIGSHSRRHPNLVEVEGTPRLEDEVVRGKQLLSEAFGVDVVGFNYPYGRFCERSLELVRRHYEYAVTTREGHVHDVTDPHRLPRIRGHLDSDRLRWELTPLASRYRRLLDPFKDAVKRRYQCP
jgi:peptidoglycan/xylan/chitin deacetylase (PgdA/CDA1 family)